MRQPQTEEEKEAYSKSCIESCEVEAEELEIKYGIKIEYLYYSSHLGV